MDPSRKSVLLANLRNSTKEYQKGMPNKNGEKRFKRTKAGTFAPGGSGGPGRPKGSLSIKDLVRQHLEENQGDLEEFVRHFIKKNRELAWQMLEGRPQQDVTSGGEKLPTPIYGGLSVQGHDGNEKDICP